MSGKEAQTPHIGENLQVYSAAGGAALAAGHPASTLACERVCADAAWRKIYRLAAGMEFLEVAKFIISFFAQVAGRAIATAIANYAVIAG